jgi:hypothetical protein
MSRLLPLPRTFSASPLPRPRAFGTRTRFKSAGPPKTLHESEERVQACLHQQAATGDALHRANPSTKKRRHQRFSLFFCPQLPTLLHAFRIINLQDLAARDRRGGSPRARAAGRSSTASDGGISSSTTAPLPSTTPPPGAKVIATPPRRGAPQPCRFTARRRGATQPCRPTPPLRRTARRAPRRAPRRRAPETAKRSQGGRLRAQAEGRARRP